MAKILMWIGGLILLGVVVWLFNAFIKWIKKREKKNTDE